MGGNTGDDSVAGGEGADRLNGGTGVDNLHGDAANDAIFGDDNSDILLGGDGDDSLYGGDSDPRVEGQILIEALSGDAGRDHIFAGSGRDFLVGGADADLLSGGTGDDNLAGDSGQRITGYVIRGDRRVDYRSDLSRTTGADDTLDGGGGFDVVEYFLAAGPVQLSLQSGTATGEGSDRLIDIEGAIGSRFDDLLEGSSVTNTLVGGKGNDTIRALGGDDFIVGSAGADSIDGGDGHDTLIFESSLRAVLKITTSAQQAFYEIIRASGEAQGDVYTGIEAFFGSAEADSLAVKGAGDADLGGGDGADTINGDKGDDTLNGDKDKDRLTGNTGSDSLDGGAGTDSLDGGVGIDSLSGGAGDDFLTGGSGSDALDGGTGFDFAVYATANSGVTVNLADPALNTGDAAGDTTTGIEGLIGSRFADRLTGDDLGNGLGGGDGADLLQGGGGADSLRGGADQDTLIGGAGSDLFQFHIAADTSGVQAQADRISDFHQSEGDQIDLRQLALVQSLTFVGTGAFSGEAGEVRFTAGPAATVLQIDLDGGSAADMVLVLTGNIALTEANILL